MTVFNDIQMTKKAVKRVRFTYFQPLRNKNKMTAEDEMTAEVDESFMN